MPRRFTIMNPLQEPEWDKWLKLFPGSTIFHSTSWERVLADSYGYTPHYYVLFDEEFPSAIVPMMEVSSFLTGVRGVSLPFSDNCEALVSPGVDHQQIVDDLKEYGRSRNWKSVELRGGGLGEKLAPPATWFYRHWLPLGGGERTVLTSFKHGTRNNIRQAQRKGVVVTTNDSHDALVEFYRLNCLTRKKHGLPPQPFSFFEKIFAHVIRHGQGKIFLTKHDGRVISAAVCLEFGRKAIVKYAATDRKHLDVRPNNILVWEIIRYYECAGFGTLDFGRSDPANEGLRRFKSGYRLKESKVTYHRYDLRKDVPFDREGLASSPLVPLFKVMPVPLLKLIGRILYRHVG